VPAVGAEVRVGPQISGVLERLHVDVGDRVVRGQLLAELEHATLDVGVRAAEARIREAEARERVTRARLKRQQALADAGLTSQESLEDAGADAELAEATLDGVQAELARALLNRGFTEIRAPIPGTVTSVSTREGETVAASFAIPTFLTIVDLDRLQLEVYIDEVDIGRVALAQRVTFELDAFPERHFTGLIHAVVPQPSVRNNLVTYSAVVTITSSDHAILRPSMTANVRIVTGTARQVLAAPKGAIRRDNKGNAFVLVREDGRDIKRDVTLGSEMGDVVAVTSGVAEGDQLVLVSPEPSIRQDAVK